MSCFKVWVWKCDGCKAEIGRKRKVVTKWLRLPPGWIYWRDPLEKKSGHYCPDCSSHRIDKYKGRRCGES